MAPESKKTSDKKLVIDFIGYSEPNNGRELWEVDVFHNSSNINYKLFSNGWNYINFRVEKWQLESFGFAYIPAESTAKLLNINTLEIHNLPYKGVSTASFIGNVFGFEKLMEVYVDLIQITDLSTFKTTTIEWKNNEFIEWVEFLNNEEIKLTLAKVEKGVRKKRSTTMAIVNTGFDL
ncbi:hypothetical protein HZY62_18320 [Maribacter polysiphoniae]|uniref:Uncharacterized protein n=1 Tax=Maribacter polysiphoniae TaxID=429344 RepID=A0A316DT68_9FLAO|nr:hypothetical protein [Maribacter polysiphoniae]MBD1262560.1 hypothetical protein [Maribacter polysiphoniae]PWK21244.1 hypothetical protein LX92_04045 [Maribacter polysiphoniae]